jgi:hypothetical protein
MRYVAAWGLILLGCLLLVGPAFFVVGVVLDLHPTINHPLTLVLGVIAPVLVFLGAWWLLKQS